MERQYINSERPHFMCPNMHFGIEFDLACEYDFNKFKSCLKELAMAHPFLRCVIHKDSNKLYYDVKEQSQIELTVRDSNDTLWEDYKQVGQKEWNVFEHGLLKVFVYPGKDGMKVLFICHHLLGDGRCLLGLTTEFADCYAKGIRPNYVEEKLIQSLQDLPEKSDLPGVSKMLVNHANKQWKKENHTVSYEEYQVFADQFVKDNPVTYDTSVVNPEQLAAIKKCCKENDITINDLLMASFYMEAKINKIIIAADIRKKLTCYRPGALGNYASAMGIICKDTSSNLIARACKVHKLVKKHMADNRKLMLVLACYLNMEDELLDASVMAARGKYQSKAAHFVGAGMFGFDKAKGFSITNLGAINSESIQSAMFIPPASPAAQLTLGVLTVNQTMKLCMSSYQQVTTTEKIANRMLMK